MTIHRTTARESTNLSVIAQALSLSMGAALALGLARFSYALLLPPMKADLHWTFAQAGALNTSNAVGYLIGALLFPLLARRVSTGRLFVFGCAAATVAMAIAGAIDAFDALLAQRLACGLFSAIVFVGGGVLATRLAALHPQHAGLVLGLYYGGTGWGIAVSALVVRWTLRPVAHGWQGSWFALAGSCAIGSALAWPAAKGGHDDAAPPTGPLQPAASPGMGRMAPLCAGYGLFGIGYIGYMTFVIALLRGAGLGGTTITAFYVVLGLATVVSGGMWSRVLHRARGGRAFALFCLILSAATFLPAFAISPVAAFTSGILFGGTFLAVVASTTVFVRQNLPPAQWSSGISIFTVVFALGQIVGPVVMGYVSDGSGLLRGFAYSAAILLVAAVVGLVQKPLPFPR